MGFLSHNVISVLPKSPANWRRRSRETSGQRQVPTTGNCEPSSSSPSKKSFDKLTRNGNTGGSAGNVLIKICASGTDDESSKQRSSAMCEMTIDDDEMRGKLTGDDIPAAGKRETMYSTKMLSIDVGEQVPKRGVASSRSWNNNNENGRQSILANQTISSKNGELRLSAENNRNIHLSVTDFSPGLKVLAAGSNSNNLNVLNEDILNCCESAPSSLPTRRRSVAVSSADRNLIQVSKDSRVLLGRNGTGSGSLVSSSSTKSKENHRLTTARMSLSYTRGGALFVGEDHFEGKSKRAIRLRNLINGAESYDTLHQRAPETLPCTSGVCQGSILMHGPLLTKPTARSKPEVLEDAKEFLDQYYTSTKKLNSAAHQKRWQEIVSEVDKRGTYELTATELVYGAKTGWRNAQRCIGRIQWAKLQVFDARYVTTTGGMFEAVCNHIKYATNKGNIRSAITIFPQRTDGLHDYRVWNSQLISYAGYRQPDGTVIGDPLNVEFTEVCLKLGWKSGGGRWDVLPLVVSAGGHDPEYYEYPDDLILQVPIHHPQYEWFAELDLRWYAVPAVSSMLFDVGGIEFPAVPFNGWYMGTEIGCRDLCDSKRYNVLEQVAVKMGLDTSNFSSLWKDKALVEVNCAVLHSYQSKNVTIIDHHAASESFMKHMENETKLRNGCPADWVWLVPPMSGSITPVFHQEMLLYHLKPSYEYQEVAWKTHVWKKNREKMKCDHKKSARKFRFREIARAVKFTSKLFGKALSRRIKATILYATETGKSEGYATLLGELFNHAFNAQVMCMSDYDVMNLEHETLVLVVASTFGNGDPPENGEEFVKHLYAMKINGSSDKEKIKAKSKAYMKLSSSNELKRSQSRDSGDRVSFNDFGPLGNVRYALFALGSNAYPNFCAFGRYIDSLIDELGGERLLELHCGDELCGQEQTFRHWARKVFQMACDVFCVGENMSVVTEAFQTDAQWTGEKVRLIPINPDEEQNTCNSDIASGLSKLHSRSIATTKIIQVSDLHPPTDDRQTVLVKLDKQQKTNDLCFYPGDHLGICPTNRKELVDGIISKMMWGNISPDQMIQVSVLKEQHTMNGLVKSWCPHDRLPICTIRTAFSRYLDLTSPPAPQLLKIFASLAQDEEEKESLTNLATDTHEYEEWKRHNYPTVLDVLEYFPSVLVEPTLLLTQLPALQPRFYSISSSPRQYSNEIHLTVAVVKFKTQNDNGPLHFGVCSTFLANAEQDLIIPCFIRSASNFRLPNDPLVPVIMVGPGTGVAPFRSFWQERYFRLSPLDNKERATWGKMSLYFGCRKQSMNIFMEETNLMVKEGIISDVYTAFSRGTNCKSRYVQDLLTENAAIVFREIYDAKGHFYVCGDVSMAEDVGKTLGKILQSVGGLNAEQADSYMISMRDDNRYHEDIFGATFRAAEVRNRQRIAS